MRVACTAFLSGALMACGPSQSAVHGTQSGSGGKDKRGSDGGAAGSDGHDADQPTATVEVVVTGFRNQSGSALIALFVSSDGFPDRGEQAWARQEVPIASATAQTTFENVPADQIAIAVLHDEDGDKKMKTGLFGRPKEGYGASRNASNTFGPPSFEDAVVTVVPDQRLRLEIKLRY